MRAHSAPLPTVLRSYSTRAFATAQYGVISCIDTTFATPLNHRPIEHGIDLVLHSRSKYLGGTVLLA